MRIVFMGSGDLACPALRAISQRRSDEVVAVVTQPDRPKGRNRRVAACPLKILAGDLGLPILSPEQVGAPDMAARLKELAPDVILVVAYGQYIPPSVLGIPSRGAINVHPSLLPKYRGAAPIQWAVACGEKETGVTILFVTDKMDAGDIILQEGCPIGDEDTAASLAPQLAELGAQLLLQALDLLRTGKVAAAPQDHGRATPAPKLSKQDGRIEWARPAEVIRCRIRGFQPWPGCFCEVPAGSGHWLRVWAARVEEGQGEPGRVLNAAGDGPLVATAAGALRLLQVQPEGGKAMSGAAYLNGHPVREGERWG